MPDPYRPPVADVERPRPIRTLSSFQAILLGGAAISYAGGWIITLTAVSLLGWLLESGGIEIETSTAWVEVLLAIFILVFFVGAILIGAAAAAYYRDQDAVLHALASGALAWMLSLPHAGPALLEDPTSYAMLLILVVLPISAFGGMLGRARRITIS